MLAGDQDHPESVAFLQTSTGFSSLCDLNYFDLAVKAADNNYGGACANSAAARLSLPRLNFYSVLLSLPFLNESLKALQSERWLLPCSSAALNVCASEGLLWTESLKCH